jgi:hypothetical protein
MKYYSFDDQFYYTGEFDADLDPRATEANGSDTYMVYDDATTIAPPTYGTNQCPKFDSNNDTWSVEPYFIGETVWDVSTLAQSTWDQEGALPGTHTLLAPPSDFSEWQGSAWDDGSVQENLAQEKFWVFQELQECDIYARYDATGDTTRMQGTTIAQWNTYVVDLRNYISNDGTINGSRPTSKPI